MEVLPGLVNNHLPADRKIKTDTWLLKVPGILSFPEHARV
jgi:hypothetical protein